MCVPSIRAPMPSCLCVRLDQELSYETVKIRVFCDRPFTEPPASACVDFGLGQIE